MKSTYYAQALLNAKRGTALSYPATMYWGFAVASKGARSALNSQAVALNDTICLIPTGGAKFQLYKVTTAGTLAAAQGSLYPGVPNEVITDGTAVLTEQSAALETNTTATIAEPTIGTNAYARLALASNTTNFAAATGQSGQVAAQIQNAGAGWVWPTATGTGWTSGSACIWAIVGYDAASAGNLWEIEGLTATVQVSGGATPSEAAGALTITEA